MSLIDFNAERVSSPAPVVDRISTLKTRMETHAAAILHYLMPAGVTRGTEFIVGNVNGIKGESLKVSLRSGKIGTGKDFATGEIFGDLIDVWKATRNKSLNEALSEIETWLGAPTTQTPQKQKAQSLGQPTGRWDYKSIDDNLILSVYRFDLPDGKKEFRPWNYATKKYGLPEIRPLFNLPGIAASGKIIICEGEKSAEALNNLGYCATTILGGANSPMDKTDWAPLKGKDIIIWPDNDEPGRQYATKVSRAAQAAGASSIKILSIPLNKPKKWDAADAVKELTKSDIDSLLASASVPNQIEKPGLPLIWFNDVAPCLDVTDFVEGLLGDNGMSVLYGESNCGKTFYATNMALHVALGRPWFGLSVEEGGVIYIAAEGGFGIRNRLAAFRAHHKPEAPNLPFAIVPSAIDLLDPQADVHRLIDLIKNAAKAILKPIRMVVIDTLARALAGGNENAPDDMGALVHHADLIRQNCNVHVMFIHHSGKDTSRGARGHSSLRAATDTEIEITRDPETKIATVTVTKQRDFDYLEPHHFILKSIELGTNRRNKTVTSCIVEKTEIDLNAKPNIKLTDHEFKALTELKNLINEDFIKPVIPLSGMSPVRAATRMQVRDWFVARWVIDVENAKSWTSTERMRFARLLLTLEKKNQIAMHGEHVWLLDRKMAVTSPSHIEDAD